MKQTVTVYGPGGFDPAKPDNNVIESYEVDVPTPAPTVEDALRIAARLSTEARVKADELPDEDVAILSLLYDPWVVGEAVAAGALRSWDGTIVECLQAHTTQADWTPDVTPALWKVHRSGSGSQQGEAPAEWVQPVGASDAYNTGDRVTFEGQVYESTIDANVWSPTDYPQGWQLIEAP
jgi:hypothetical protein